MKKNKPKILFMGTPDFAAAVLRAVLDAGENVVAVVTGEDRQRGRGMHTVPTPVKALAEERGVRVFQPSTLRGEDFAELLMFLAPDLILVAAYGKILPENVLEFPKYGCVNAHASLLPKYRGAAPIQRAIMAGESETGVCAMMMEAGLDTGDVLCREVVPIAPDDTFAEVHGALCEAGGRVLVRVCEAISRGEELPREKQDDALSTYAKKITKEDGVLDFADAKECVDRIRALSPAPAVEVTLPDGSALKITRARVSEAQTAAAAPGTVIAVANCANDPDTLGTEQSVPGTVIAVAKKYFTVACEKGAFDVTEVVPQGKKKMDAASFINGRKIAVGDKLS